MTLLKSGNRLGYTLPLNSDPKVAFLIINGIIYKG